MSCEPYSKSLTDAAAAGESLSYPLQQHLASCESCRGAFALEQSLFSAIDFGLRAATNSEVPATLLPRVRAGIVDAPQPRRFSFSNLAMASTALGTAAIVAFFYLQSRAPSTRTATIPASASRSAGPLHSISPSIVNPRASRSVSPLQHDARVTLVAGRSPNPKPPDVIVAPEEGAALLRYEALLRKTRATGFQTTGANPFNLHFQIEPLEIAEIELGELNISPLARSDQEGDTK
jgi:hypothetical protein